MADEILDGTDMMSQLLGERQRFPDQTRDTLPQRVIEALDVLGSPGVLRDGFMLLRRNDTAISVVLIRVECGLRTVHPRDLGPQLSCALSIAIADVKGDDLAGPGIHGDPDPLFIRPLPDEAPRLIGFGFQLPNHHVGGADGQLDVSVFGTGRKALDHKMQERCETDAHRTADAT